MEINMKQEIQLSCFVVPNSIRKLGYVTLSNVNGTHIWDKDVDELERMSKFGVWPVRGARYIQVWIHCPAEGENSNWTDHGIPEQNPESPVESPGFHPDWHHICQISAIYPNLPDTQRNPA